MQRRARKAPKNKRSKKISSHEKWMRKLRKFSNVYEQTDNSGGKQLMIVYDDQIPARMPSPGGPSRGAALTMTQTVRGNDMTLGAGGAIVGALIRQNTATDVFAAWAFCLADIPNITAVSSLFDQYRIEEVQFRLKTKNPAIYIASATSPNYATTSPLVVVDRDDATVPTTLAELQQFDNCQFMAAQDNIDIVLQPSVTPSVFSGGAFSGYAVAKSTDYWLDVANTSIPHYGIKIGMPALVTSTTQKFDWDVIAWYKVSFKNVR